MYNCAHVRARKTNVWVSEWIIRRRYFHVRVCTHGRKYMGIMRALDSCALRAEYTEISFNVFRAIRRLIRAATVSPLPFIHRITGIRVRYIHLDALGNRFPVAGGFECRGKVVSFSEKLARSSFNFARSRIPKYPGNKKQKPGSSSFST